MSCQEIHFFALEDDDVATLQAFYSEQDCKAHLQDTLAQRYRTGATPYIAASHKAWDALHRALADGGLSWDSGSFPLNHTVLGGQLLYSSSDFIMSLKTPPQVKAIAAALDALTEDDFRRRYDQIDPDSHATQLDDADFASTWQGLQGVRQLYRRAATEWRHVLFAAEQ